MQPAAITVPLQPVHAQAVYGLNIRDTRLATLTKRVLTMAMLSAILIIIGQVLGFIVSPNKSVLTAASALIGMGVGLLVPLCGYLGAKKSDSSLACCFCGCNCVLSVMNVIAVAMIAFGYVGIKYLLDNCEPANPSESCNLPPSYDWSQTCASMGKPDLTPEQCWQYLDDTVVGALMTSLIVQVAVCIPTFTLNCLSFCFGKQLYDALKQGQVLHVAPLAPVMATVAAQPVTYQQQ